MKLQGAIVCLAQACMGVHRVVFEEGVSRDAAFHWLDFARRAHILIKDHEADERVVIMVGERDQCELAMKRHEVVKKRLEAVDMALSV